MIYLSYPTPGHYSTWKSLETRGINSHSRPFLKISPRRLGEHEFVQGAPDCENALLDGAVDQPQGDAVDHGVGAVEILELAEEVG